jgi:hypothetical protein
METSFSLDKPWLHAQYHKNCTIKRPDELENELIDPPAHVDKRVLDRIHGSMVGMALGDALGAHVAFKPNDFLEKNPVMDLKGGGTWGLKKGQVILLRMSSLQMTL